MVELPTKDTLNDYVPAENSPNYARGDSELTGRRLPTLGARYDNIFASARPSLLAFSPARDAIAQHTATFFGTPRVRNLSGLAFPNRFHDSILHLRVPPVRQYRIYSPMSTGCKGAYIQHADRSTGAWHKRLHNFSIL